MDLVEGFETVNTIFLVPRQARREVLFDVSGQGAEDLVVCIYVVDVRFVSAAGQ